jgi:hypothetical protein
MFAKTKPIRTEARTPAEALKALIRDHLAVIRQASRCQRCRQVSPFAEWT